MNGDAGYALQKLELSIIDLATGPGDMMKRTSKYIIYLFMTVIITGCSTLKTNFDDKEPQWGNEYSGTNCAAKTTLITLALPYYWWAFPFSLLDTALSFVADTILLPFELAADNPDYDYPNCGSM